MANINELHVEKGVIYVGISPDDLETPEFQNFKEVLTTKKVPDGDYRWDMSSRQLVPTTGQRAT